MDSDAIERARERIEAAAAGRIEPGAVDAALERAREQIESLAAAAAAFEANLPQRVGDAVLMNQMIRRLERVEGDLLAERHARVDDLALLVDLVTSGWRSVDRRIAHLEESITRDGGAVIYRIEERRSPESHAG